MASYRCHVKAPAWCLALAISFHLSTVKYSKSRASRKTTDSSDNDPSAMSRQRRNSAGRFAKAFCEIGDR
jgi:hypothetical protein